MPSTSTTTPKALKPAEDVLPLLFEGKPPGLERLLPGRQVDEERVRAQAGVDAQPFEASTPSSSTRKRAVSPDGDDAAAVLHWPGAIRAGLRRLEGAGEDELRLLRAERKRPSVFIDRKRPQPEAADDRVREGRIRRGSGWTVITSTRWPGRSGLGKA